MQNQLSLRIKKVYFDAIINGEKTSEYRQYNDYYHQRFTDAGKFNVLKIYYNNAYAIIQIKEIGVSPNPLPIKDRPEFLATKMVYELKLGKVYWVNR